MKRILLIGAASGAVLGALFALAVISFADCAGPNCASERVTGILGHAAAGAAAGLLLASLVGLAGRVGRVGTVPELDAELESEPEPDSATPSTAWEGFGSLEAAVAGLRRGRFRIRETLRVSGRGLVLAGEIVEGEVRPGMVILPVLVNYPNVYTSLPVIALEAIAGAVGRGETGLVVQPEDWEPGSVAEPLLAPGTLLDVLERAPAA